ncbi:hypothetical protein CQW23_25312 [Capsicum baccatum]|uniref:Uncharacterized protein n=1 Tax=Capsicum baccatum TaxID=33114 RepID=A0A2G2VKK8_CAPBA|nr:hypothetical protein CQW23_25312 [Capsicum baccatum]
MNNNSTSDNFSCGVEKFSTGAGGCSNYSEIDVENKLGSRLKSLRDDCRLMGSGGGGLTKGCNKCLRTWREIAKNDTTELEDDICRFSMLILLTSQRVSDESWVDKIFHCLGDNSLPLASADESGNETRRRTKFKTVSDEFYSEESTYRRLSLKEIYSATDNLSIQQTFFYLPALKPNSQTLVCPKLLALATHMPAQNFGIVLLQLLSGQRVINVDLKKPLPLCKMAKNLTKGGNIKKFADQKLEGKFSMVALELVFKLALSSIGHNKQRPSMEQVVIKLEEALDLSTRIESVHPWFKSIHSLYLVSPD